MYKYRCMFYRVNNSNRNCRYHIFNMFILKIPKEKKMDILKSNIERKEKEKKKIKEKEEKKAFKTTLFMACFVYITCNNRSLFLNLYLYFSQIKNHNQTSPILIPIQNLIHPKLLSKSKNISSIYKYLNSLIFSSFNQNINGWIISKNRVYGDHNSDHRRRRYSQIHISNYHRRQPYDGVNFVRETVNFEF